MNPKTIAQDREHTWKITPLVKIYTCEKCGLLKLETQNGVFHFVRFSEPYLQCSSPYAYKEQEAKEKA